MAGVLILSSEFVCNMTKYELAFYEINFDKKNAKNCIMLFAAFVPTLNN
jgi:hypothetical protein